MKHAYQIIEIDLMAVNAIPLSTNSTQLASSVHHNACPAQAHQTALSVHRQALEM